MEEKTELFNSAEETLNALIDLKTNYKPNVLGPSLINIFETVSKFNEENKNYISNLYKPHESIYADVISSFENPNCTCRKRFSNFIDENVDVSKNVFFSLLSFLSDKEGEKVLKTLKSFYDHFKLLSENETKKASEPKEVEIVSVGAKGSLEPENTVTSSTEVKSENVILTEGGKEVTIEKEVTETNTTAIQQESYMGKSFIINKTVEEYSKFFENLVKVNAQYNGMSVIPYNLNQMMVLFY